MFKVDALFFLLIVEFSFLSLVFIVLLVRKNRKYRKRLKALEEGRFAEPDHSDRDPDSEGKAFRENAQAESSPNRPAMFSFPDEPEASTADDPLAAIDRLRKTVDFQKGIILDLMCYKDLFESAQKRLSSIQKKNETFQNKLAEVMEKAGQGQESIEMVSQYAKTNLELESFLRVIEKENKSLTEKFRAWESDLKKVSEMTSGRRDVDEGEIAELYDQKKELLSKLSELEMKLTEKDKILAEMQSQYDSLDQEYMTLYRQAQGGQ